MNVDPGRQVKQDEASGAGPAGPILRTSRLLLRRWRDEDNAPFAALNADPAVMEFFPHLLTRAESDRFATHADQLFDRYGYGLWAVESLDQGAFLGFVGLSAVPAGYPFPENPFHFAPTVEVGWRLAHEAWGRGYASEAAREAVGFGFETAGLDEVVSFTSEINLRSRRVMEKIGMHSSRYDDFDHPRLAQGDRLQRHVLYRLGREEWSAAAGNPDAAAAGGRD